MWRILALEAQILVVRGQAFFPYKGVPYVNVDAFWFRRTYSF